MLSFFIAICFVEAKAKPIVKFYMNNIFNKITEPMDLVSMEWVEVFQ